ncbi:uncharacterized protein K02A2.6-like [Patiria miniata]|uniref:Endonuclease n=1 Tax=Patiria miniata TaxID=46514 RepID=A0A914AGA9_PATMI|nr:uncharacterized protein K02A2.6-like [Patiria miniata]
MTQSTSLGAVSSAPLIGRLDQYDQVEDIRNYIERLNLYFVANDIPAAKQSAVLLSAVGATVYKTVKSLAEPTPVSAKSFKELCDMLVSHYGPKRLVVAERFRFYKREQHMDESIAQYAVALRDLASPCQFGTFLDDALRDRLICGLRSEYVQKHLLTKDSLTFQKALDVAKTLETATKDLREIKGAHNTAAVHAMHPKPRQKMPHNRSTKPNTHQARCPNCGYDPSHATCPARGQKCKSCHKTGHFSRVCRSKPKHTRAVMAPTSSDDETEFFVGSVSSKSAPSHTSWHQTILVEKKPINFLLDTGSEVNILPLHVYHTLKLHNPTLQSTTTTRLCGFFGGKVQPRGQKRLSCEVKGKYHILTFLIIGDGEPVLGKHACVSLNLVQRVYTMINDDDVYEGTGCLKGPPVKIKLTENATPHCVHAPRRIPLPLHPQLKAELDKMEKQGIVTRITEPTDWCAPIVIAPKKNGNIRVCVDLRMLNKAVAREQFSIPTLEEVLGKIAGAQLFSVLDAKHGFWQIPLHPDSQKLTTFITPFGRFCFNRLPFGITSAPELYQRIMSDLLVNLPGVVVYMDDVLVTGATPEEHDARLRHVLQILQGAGLKLNKDKCKIAQEQVHFLGHRLDKHGIHPDPAKLDAILQMSPPTTKEEVKRLMGMVNWLSRFIPHAATVAAPINALMKGDTEWTWGPAQRSAFRHLKTLLTTAPTLAYYDPTKPTMVSADASSYGIGGYILQKQEDESWRPVAYCYRSLTRAEQRYAQIEKELLAAVWSCERFFVYLRGLRVTLQTDHKPLVSLINKKDLCDAPLRCQRLLMRLMRYNCEAEYTPGKDLVVADALSRAPLQRDKVAEPDEDLEGEIEAHVHLITTQWPASDAKLVEIALETSHDRTLSAVITHVKDGWPKYQKDVDPELKRFWDDQDKISLVGGILTYGDRIVIPQSLRQQMLQRIHEGHQGVSKSRLRANQALWWPGMSTDIAQYVQSCPHCQDMQPSQRAEPLMSTPLPQRPWQQIACDLAEVKGKMYLVLVDYYSRWIELHHLHSTTAKSVINFIKATFARYGIPEVVVTDNGPQFLGEFDQFAREYNFQHITSSPYYPQANGQAEKAVHIAKRLLSQDDPVRALMLYRSTPLPSLGQSPASLLMGREIRTTLPILPRYLQPKKVDHNKLKATDNMNKQKSGQTFNKRHGARQLDDLMPGDKVKIRTKGQLSPEGEVVRQAGTPRSYIININGTEYRRNRRHIFLLPKPSLDPVLDIQTSCKETKDPQPAESRPTRVTRPPVWHKDYIVSQN